MLGLIASGLYTFAVFGLAVWGLQSLALTGLFLFYRHRQHGFSSPAALPTENLTPGDWPTVTVQLPLYNERHVVERLVAAACALDYPTDRLTIQVLDDSTDDTAQLAEALVADYRSRGIDIRCLHRRHREGYKAGALAAGLAATHSDFVAIFDADFLPPSDFLKRLLPQFHGHPRAGVIQARWGHLNAGYNALTRAQALALDGHFVVEQTARGRSGLPLNFNGSAGIWRRSCIEQAGGWQSDTLAEDLDLSYRAQLQGWQVVYAPEVVVPAEIPPQMAAYRHQQYRWACGSLQVLRKLLRPWLASPRLPAQRLGGLLHLGAYLAYPLMLLSLLASLPLALTGAHLPPVLRLASVAGLGPPAVFILSQWAAYPSWHKRLAALPGLFFLGLGLMLNNTCAVLNAFIGRPAFTRTPKFNLAARDQGWRRSAYVLKPDGMVWGQLALTAYAALTLVVAIHQMSELVPYLTMMLIGGIYVTWWELAPIFLARPNAGAARPRAAIARRELPQKIF
jgi:cellulose synthase/poly-beta-1,6-N-acetylglucosamine synthase-like glycosyltransferase